MGARRWRTAEPKKVRTMATLEEKLAGLQAAHEVRPRSFVRVVNLMRRLWF